ncbi:MAG: hypothetical protein ACRC1P_09995 [Cellulosilyticaceae bacterium]
MYGSSFRKKGFNLDLTIGQEYGRVGFDNRHGADRKVGRSSFVHRGKDMNDCEFVSVSEYKLWDK